MGFLIVSVELSRFGNPADKGFRHVGGIGGIGPGGDLRLQIAETGVTRIRRVSGTCRTWGDVCVIPTHHGLPSSCDTP